MSSEILKLMDFFFFLVCCDYSDERTSWIPIVPNMFWTFPESILCYIDVWPHILCYVHRQSTRTKTTMSDVQYTYHQTTSAQMFLFDVWLNLFFVAFLYNIIYYYDIFIVDKLLLLLIFKCMAVDASAQILYTKSYIYLRIKKYV